MASGVKRKRLVIIDGKSIFYRGYFAMPFLSTKDGVPTGGVFGFASMALEIIRKLKPDYVCVAWDKPKTNIRKRLKIYPHYKAGRKPAPPDFNEQIPILHELLEAFGWPLYELDDYEADDIMGALAVQATAQDIETMLVTSDLDMLQLIDLHVSVYALKKGLSHIELYHPESFVEKYGLMPNQFLDLKALKGDSSDNIPGVPGIGEKGAIELLKQFGTLDNIYENIELIKDVTKKKLIAGKESAHMSKQLAAIWTDAPVKLNLSNLDGSKCNPVRVREILQKLEFKSLLRVSSEIWNGDIAPQKKVSPKLIIGKNIIINDINSLKKLILPKSDELIIHSQLNKKDPFTPDAISISSNKELVFVFDVKALGKKNFSNKIKEYLIRTPLVGYDLKSTLKCLLNLGIDAKDIKHDAMVGSFLINSLRRDQSLEELASQDLKIHLAYSDNQVVNEAETIAVIRALYELQQKTLQTMPKLNKLAQNIEWPIIPVLAQMEYVGIKLDTKYLETLSVELEDKIINLEQEIYGIASQQFNINSPLQLAEVLFKNLKLPTEGIKKTKSGYSTAASELAKLQSHHEIIAYITQFREYTKLKNTYIDTLPKMVDKNSRLHTTFNLTIAQTGRLSSNDPNLQNIPVRTEIGKQIREAFVADTGKVFVSADYSQFELRLAAFLSKDKKMIEMFNRDVDIHTATASEIFGRNPEDVTKNMRRDAKIINFGILYGMSTHGLSVATGMSREQAESFIKKYFELREPLLEYLESLKKQAKEEGYVETLFGRRRPMPDIKSSNFMVRSTAERAAINMPIQGTEADLMKMAMIQINKKLDEDCKQLLQIHDSILVECPENKAKLVAKLLQNIMQNIYKLPVKLTVDTSIGKTWGDL
jgi:DNA polymerase-1